MPAARTRSPGAERTRLPRAAPIASATWAICRTASVSPPRLRVTRAMPRAVRPSFLPPPVNGGAGSTVRSGDRRRHQQGLQNARNGADAVQPGWTPVHGIQLTCPSRIACASSRYSLPCSLAPAWDRSRPRPPPRSRARSATRAARVLPQVAVTAPPTETGLTRTAVTGPDGRYTLPLLPVGIWELRAELSGFKPMLQHRRRDIDRRARSS